jgi:RNA polymerase sigma-70 factor (ECF subfamily)
MTLAALSARNYLDRTWQSMAARFRSLPGLPWTRLRGWTQERLSDHFRFSVVYMKNTTDMLTDAEVIDRVLEGDVESFAILVDRYQNEFVRYAKYMTGSADDAADILQESLVRAYKSLRRCQDRENFRGWFFRIVSNQCKSHAARSKRRVMESLSARPDDLAAAEDPVGEAEAADLQHRVYHALQELPKDQREAIVLKYVEGHSLPEMARLLQISVAALKMRLLRGRSGLRRKLEGVGP